MSVVAMLHLVAQISALSHASIDTARGIDFHAVVEPETVYVGQQATYQVGVFIDSDLRMRLHRNPEFVPPEPQGMLTYDMPLATPRPATRRVGRHLYEVHIFQRALFPLMPGDYEIPAAELNYAIPLSLSFFSREEEHSILAESADVVAIPPPASGRPDDYSGAVGDLHVQARIDSSHVRAGDPVVLTIRVEGRSDVKLLPRPTLTLSWASVVPAQERVDIDNTKAGEVSGSKEFDWLVTPHDSGTLTVPAIRYPFFNPYTAHYDVALTSPQLLHVSPGTGLPIDSVSASPVVPLAIRADYRGTLPAPFYQTPLFLALSVIAPIPALVATGWRRPRRRKRPKAAALRLRRLASRRKPADAVLVRRLFVQSLSDRFALTSEMLTTEGALAHALRREGVTAETSNDVERVLGELNHFVFSSAGTGTSTVESRRLSPEQAEEVAILGQRAVAEARERVGPMVARSAGWLAVGVVGSLVFGWAVARALDVESRDAQEFGLGSTAYAGHRYAESAEHFAAAAALAPHAPDAWANAGAAEWMMGDTTDAVVAWQRAGRLEPWARDIRDDLALVRASQTGAIAQLPIVPVEYAADGALALWGVVCLIALVRAARGRRVWSPLLVVVVSGAAALAVLAFRIDEHEATEVLTVTAPRMTLYAAPALDAEREWSLEAGAVAEVEGTSGLWSHVRLDGDRDGWVESAKLTSIALPESHE